MLAQPRERELPGRKSHGSGGRLTSAGQGSTGSRKGVGMEGPGPHTTLVHSSAETPWPTARAPGPGSCAERLGAQHTRARSGAAPSDFSPQTDATVNGTLAPPLPPAPPQHPPLPTQQTPSAPAPLACCLCTPSPTCGHGAASVTGDSKTPKDRLLQSPGGKCQGRAADPYTKRAQGPAAVSTVADRKGLCGQLAT